MFTVQETSTKYRIFKNGKLVSEYNKADIEFSLIEEKLEILNRPKVIITRKVKGVVDNRHRNWRRRK